MAKAKASSKKAVSKKAVKKKTNDDNAAEEILLLREEYDELKERKVEAGTNLKNTEKALKKLKAEALKKYGSDDPVELAKKLEAMRCENTKKIADYQSELGKIVNELDEIDAKYNELEEDE